MPLPVPFASASACGLVFGEMPLGMDEITALAMADVFIAIGTSGHVYPAAGFVQARLHGAHTRELNLEPSGGKRI